MAGHDRRARLLGRLLIGYVDEAAGLAAPQGGVMAIAAQLLVMRALFDDTAAVEHNQPVHLRDRRQTVRNGDHGTALHERAEAGLDCGFHFAV